MPQHYGGGFSSLSYSLKKALQTRAAVEFWRRMRSKNACRSCALGMGGQAGGMRDERGRFPEVCKKSVEALAADMAPGLPERFFQNRAMQEMRGKTSQELEACGRLSHPLYKKKGSDRYKPVSWDAAYDRLVEALRSCGPDETAFYASGRSSNEAAFLFQTFARALGTNNIDNCSRYCHQASTVGLSRSVGTGTATASLDDLLKADFAMVLGANPASNHPRLVARLTELRKSGGKVVVVNPVREPGLVKFRLPSNPKSLLLGSKVSDLYVQPRIGGDIALIYGMLKRLIESGGTDVEFIRNRCLGWEAVEDKAKALAWTEIEEKSGVDRKIISEAAWMYQASGSAAFLWGMGATQHAHGVDNVSAIANLALARGMAGRPGAGLIPIRGHSNVQGVGSMGVAPALKEKFAEALSRKLGGADLRRRGLDALEAIEAANDGRLKTLVCLGGNLYGASPDAAFCEKALGRLEFTAHISTKLNTGHFRGAGKASLILPALARDEERHPTTQESMFNFVRVSEGGFEGPPGAASETEIVSELAARVISQRADDWRRLRSHDVIRDLIADLVPGYAPIRGVGEGKKEFCVEGRLQRTPVFGSTDGRAHFFAVDVPGGAPPEGRWTLMTLRSEGQYNTVVYEKEDVYRGQSDRDVILMNSRDAHMAGLREEDLVRVESEVGRLDNVRVRLFDIAPRCAAMYFPEANALVPRSRDPLSGTPAFKSVEISIRPMAGA